MGLFDRLRSIVGGGSDDDSGSDADATASQDATSSDDAGGPDAVAGADSVEETARPGETTERDGPADDDAVGETDAAADDDTAESDEEPISWEETGFEQLTSQLVDEDEESEEATVDDLITEAESDATAAGGPDVDGEARDGRPDAAADASPAVATDDHGEPASTADADVGTTEADETGGFFDEGAEPGADVEPSAGDASPSGADDGLRLPLEEGPATDDAGTSAGAEDRPTEGPRAEFVADARDLVEFWGEYDLDFTVDSLERLDRYVAEQWGDERFEDVEFGGEDYDSAVFTEQVRRVGSYLGEVLVRDRDGEWVHREDVGWLVELGDGEVVPVFHIVQSCLTGEATVVETVEAVLDERS